MMPVVDFEPLLPSEMQAPQLLSQLYAVVDACDLGQVPELCDTCGPERARCLYSGKAHEDLWGVAPYLFKLDESLLNWTRDDLGGEPWGFFCESRSPLDVVLSHFRRFLIVCEPTGEEAYFRFYDPRVLMTFLRAASAQQASLFFGPIGAYLIPHEIDGKPGILRATRRSARIQ